MRHAWIGFVSAWLALACGPRGPEAPEHAPSTEMLDEIEARRQALLQCIPPIDIRRHDKPVVRVGAGCRVIASSGRETRGYTDMRQYVVVPAADLGALAHEYAHWYAGDWGHGGYTESCGDRIDSYFLRDKGYPCRGM